MKDEDYIREMQVLALKEAALSKIVAWLKGRGLWEECNNELNLVDPSPKKALLAKAGENIHENFCKQVYPEGNICSELHTQIKKELER
ncbi:MAG: hypothetical protein ABL876_07995 [Chitinophagaceae bacterium]